jgi:hypothetical protein
VRPRQMGFWIRIRLSVRVPDWFPKNLAAPRTSDTGRWRRIVNHSVTEPIQISACERKKSDDRTPGKLPGNGSVAVLSRPDDFTDKEHVNRNFHVASGTRPIIHRGAEYCQIFGRRLSAFEVCPDEDFPAFESTEYAAGVRASGTAGCASEFNERTRHMDRRDLLRNGAAAGGSRPTRKSICPPIRTFRPMI